MAPHRWIFSARDQLQGLLHRKWYELCGHGRTFVSAAFLMIIYMNEINSSEKMTVDRGRGNLAKCSLLRHYE
jgi:hypothetical protein